MCVFEVFLFGAGASFPVPGAGDSSGGKKKSLYKYGYVKLTAVALIAVTMYFSGVPLSPSLLWEDTLVHLITQKILTRDLVCRLPMLTASGSNDSPRGCTWWQNLREMLLLVSVGWLANYTLISRRLSSLPEKTSRGGSSYTPGPQR